VSIHDSDGSSSESDYQQGANEESEDALEYVDEQDAGTEIGSGGKKLNNGLGSVEGDYQPGTNMESEDALDYVDERDAGTEIASGGKKQKKGVAGRKEIQKIRSQMLSMPLPVEHVDTATDRGQKRKAEKNQKHEYFFPYWFSKLIISLYREVLSKNKKPRGPPVPSGMLKDWESQDFGLLPQAQESNARSRSSTSVGSWRSSDVDCDISMDTSSDGFVIGGIPSDDDKVEHKEVATGVVSKRGSVSFQVSANFFSLN
jgi:hypothetical protein